MYDGLHRHCFNCKHISHDENSCPLLTEQEREIRRKQRLENNINGETSLNSIQPAMRTPEKSLKRPRSPLKDSRVRSSSPQAAWREDRRDDKRQKKNLAHDQKEYSKSYYGKSKNADEVNYPRSSGRNLTRHPEVRHTDVWNRIERPPRAHAQGPWSKSHDTTRGRYRDRTGETVQAPKAQSHLVWRPRPHLRANAYDREPRSANSNVRTVKNMFLVGNMFVD